MRPHSGKSDLKPESIKCVLTNGSETQVTVWSGHGTNEQFFLHVNRAYSTTKKWDWFPHMTRPYWHSRQKQELKAVPCKPAKGTLGKSKAEKKTTESLLQKAEVVNLKKKLTVSAHEIFQLYANLLTEKAHQPRVSGLCNRLRSCDFVLGVRHNGCLIHMCCAASRSND